MTKKLSFTVNHDLYQEFCLLAKKLHVSQSNLGEVLLRYGLDEVSSKSLKPQLKATRYKLAGFSQAKQPERDSQ